MTKSPLLFYSTIEQHIHIQNELVITKEWWQLDIKCYTFFLMSESNRSNNNSPEKI